MQQVGTRDQDYLRHGLGRQPRRDTRARPHNMLRDVRLDHVGASNDTVASIRRSGSVSLSASDSSLQLAGFGHSGRVHLPRVAAGFRGSALNYYLEGLNHVYLVDQITYEFLTESAETVIAEEFIPPTAEGVQGFYEYRLENNIKRLEAAKRNNPYLDFGPDPVRRLTKDEKRAWYESGSPAVASFRGSAAGFISQRIGDGFGVSGAAFNSFRSGEGPKIAGGRHLFHNPAPGVASHALSADQLGRRQGDPRNARHWGGVPMPPGGGAPGEYVLQKMLHGAAPGVSLDKLRVAFTVPQERTNDGVFGMKRHRSYGINQYPTGVQAIMPGMH